MFYITVILFTFNTIIRLLLYVNNYFNFYNINCIAL
nr:MAG TPA: hypothetical protein [Caudoviricetes sp.]